MIAPGRTDDCGHDAQGASGDVDAGEKTGHGWTWTYNVLKELTASGVLKEPRAGGNKTWMIVDLAPLDDGALVPA